MSSESSTTESHLILVRFGGEVTIKSRRTRMAFLRQLRRNIRDALNSAGIEHRVESVWGRMFVRAASPLALPVLARVFGISSVSLVERELPAELATIVEQASSLFRPAVEGRRFAVRARRTGRHDYSSKDIEIGVGAALLPHAAGVDLTRPEVTVHIEVRDEVAYLFSDRVAGAGGLPLGVEGRAVALLSGGYDSAVSAWLLLKRGVALDYVFCNLGGDAYERAVVQVGKALADDWSYGSQPRLHVVDFADVLRELREQTRDSYWQVVLKRLMYRAACSIAGELRAEAVVTGEAVGQVSSQTLSNLRAIESVATLPVFRPLIGFDKGEIIDRARSIGTAALSEQVKEYCAIAPGYPVTAASIARVDEEEEKMDLSVLERAVAERKTLDLRALSPSDLAAPYLFIETFPDNAVVIDCRPERQFQTWHLKGARHMDEWELLRDFRRFDKDPTYVLYCAHGIQTAYLAERMQRHGYEAYSFRGGVRGVMKYAQEQGLNLTLLR
ncbi:MAG TPA: tRNA uracil 4-sulfurtransferase ThiI [Longimicrobiales bacterium]|nr:tRNA uracil 4-sulfurtransferase ThiI [Longimicrobiales bacterium]